MNREHELPDYPVYCREVLHNVEELKQHYPFCSMIVPPTREPSPIRLNVIAVNIDTIRETQAQPEDYMGEYSHELHIIVPFNYKKNGCLVYGAKWLQYDKIPNPDWHFNGRHNGELLFCIGVPQSFSHLDNVILENVKTAENMLIAYKLFVCGLTDHVDLLAYPHGNKGVVAYHERQTGKAKGKR